MFILKKYIFSFGLALLLLLGGCAENIQLDYSQSFTISAFKSINKEGGANLQSAQAADLAYVLQSEIDSAPESVFADCTETEKYYFTQIRYVINITWERGGSQHTDTRYFSISGYDFTEILAQKHFASTIDALAAERYAVVDISPLARFLYS